MVGVDVAREEVVGAWEEKLGTLVLQNASFVEVAEGGTAGGWVPDDLEDGCQAVEVGGADGDVGAQDMY